MGDTDRADGPTPRKASWLSVGTAIDRPVFWWSAAGVFLANAALSAAENRWLVALLQTLTGIWALVAGVTVHYVRSPGRAHRRSGLPDRR